MICGNIGNCSVGFQTRHYLLMRTVMNFVKLSDEQREFFDAEGYLVVEDVSGG